MIYPFMIRASSVVSPASSGLRRSPQSHRTAPPHSGHSPPAPRPAPTPRTAGRSTLQHRHQGVTQCTVHKTDAWWEIQPQPMKLLKQRGNVVPVIGASRYLCMARFPVDVEKHVSIKLTTIEDCVGSNPRGHWARRDREAGKTHTDMERTYKCTLAKLGFEPGIFLLWHFFAT